MLAGALRAASNALTPPPIKMLEMSMAYHQTILVHIAQKFKIPDLLASGPLSAAEVAAKIGSDPVYVERIMYACAANGVFKLVAGPRFVNTALSAVLRVDHPNSVRGLVGHNAEDAYPAWGKLADFLSTGPDLSKASIAWDLAFPQYPFAKDQGGIWAKFEANPAQEDQFGRAMTSIDSIGGAAMVEDGPFAKFSRVVDVGGGRGHFVHRILQAHPQMRGVVVDRAPVVELAKKAWAAEFASLTPTLTPTLNLNPNPNPDSTLTPALTPTPTQKGVGRRVRLGARPRAAGGGRLLRCLDHPLPKGKDGDGYYMRYILHDWPTQQALDILRNVRAAIGSANATLLLGECALPDHDTVGVPPAMYQVDIQMMALFGEAQERTPTQWRTLLEQGGFEVVGFHPTRSLLHWVEAKPV